MIMSSTIIKLLLMHHCIIDVDECATRVDECDQNCQNNVGSYTCSCNLGYILNVDGFRCDGMSSHYSTLKIKFYLSKLQTLMSVL